MRITLMVTSTAIVGACIVSCSTFAGTQSWINSSGGLFTDAANWRPGAPTSADTALFDLGSAYSVSFDQDISTSDLNVRQGDVTFDLGGFTYSLSPAAGDHIRIAQLTGQPATLRITNGTLSDRTLRVGLGGIGVLVIDGANAHVNLSNSANAGYTSTGTILIQNGAELMDDTGLVGLITNGSVIVSGRGSHWLNTSLVNAGNPNQALSASLNVVDGGLVTSPTTDVARSGRIEGNATLQTHLQIQGGAVWPGGQSHTATITVDGDYTNVSDVVSNLSIELGGAVPNDPDLGFDVLNVTGTAALNYKLTVTLINGFSPPRGWAFDIVTAGARTGVFSQLVLPALPNGGAFTLQYLSDRVRLITPGPLGDATGDNLVNAADLLAVINNWGPCPGGAGCSGDVNGDGQVNAGDLLLVINNWS
jgi:hypothetical protein